MPPRTEITLSLRSAVYPVVAFTIFLTVLLSIWVITPFCTLGWPRLPTATASDFVLTQGLELELPAQPSRKMYLGGYPLNRDRLVDVMAMARSQNLRFFIRADMRLQYAAIRDVLEAAREAKLGAVTLITERPRDLAQN